MNQFKLLTTIGRAERISFLDSDTHDVPAKVDTGADLSSIWASSIKEENGHLSFKLFAPESQYYTDEIITLSPGDYRLTRVANSFGNKEMRYVVKLRIKIKGRTIKSSFSLANRSAKVYPVLLGRRLLKGKFVVDVAQGQPLEKEEKLRLQKLHAELSEREDG